MTARRKRGPPPGNRNAFKTGRHDKDARALRQRIAAFRRRARALLAAVKGEIDRKRAEAPPS